MPTGSVINGLSVDIEDWFQVANFDGAIDRDTWEQLGDRVERNCDVLLAAFDEAGVKATFFTLGLLAQRFPALMRRIAEQGHELASHGWDQGRVCALDQASFARDLEHTRKVIEDAAGVLVTGYRAPSCSIDHRTPWAYRTLAEQGYGYSSSVAPIAHERFGWSEAPRFAFKPLPWSNLVEIPMTTAEFAGRRLATGAAGFFRALPFAASRWAIRQVNRREGRPAVLCLQPWEIDPAQARVTAARLRARKAREVPPEASAVRLQRLLREFAWGRMDVLALREAPLARELAA